jgi:phytanoyl-CoA hydroxylase
MLTQEKIGYLTQEQVDYFNKNGFLRIPQLFTPNEIDELADELDRLVQDWSFTSEGWTGPWRLAYMNPEVEKKSKLTAMHDLHLYSEAWMRGVTNTRLASAISQLIGPNVELHHSTMHIKPPQTGHPFPMHQDYPFYEHTNEKFIDALVHLDDTFHENGEIRFTAGSHKLGKLKHVLETPKGPCTPHLPFDQYALEDTVAVPAKRGDVVLFNYYTIHGSHINSTNKPRRLVRLGYRDPHNDQMAGQSHGRPGVMVKGYRTRREGDQLFSQE